MMAEEKPEKKQGGDSLEILRKTRTIIISGEVNQKLSEKIAYQLLYLQEVSEDPIKILVNTQGGHVEAGDTIHDMLKFVKPKIIVVGTGWVASAGIIIFLGAEKENRYSLPNTRYLIHQPSGGMQGVASDIEIEANEILRMKKRLNKIISERTGQPFEKIEKDADRNFWLSAEEAKDYGIVSHIISKYDEIKL